jgi:hypothetical protein
MKNLQRPLSYLLSILLISTLFLFSHCSEDDDEKNENADLIGTWTMTSIDIDLMIDGKSLMQFLIEDAGLSEAEAALLETFFKSTLEDEISSGQIELKADNTYIADFGDDPDTGKWSYNASTMILTIDSNDPDEDIQEIKVKSVSSTTLVIEQSEVVEEDLDDDQINEEIDTMIEMIFTKS